MKSVIKASYVVSTGDRYHIQSGATKERKVPKWQAYWAIEAVAGQSPKKLMKPEVFMAREKAYLAH